MKLLIIRVEDIEIKSRENGAQAYDPDPRYGGFCGDAFARALPSDDIQKS